MKVLWVCNTPPEEVARDAGLPPSLSGGWVSGLFSSFIAMKSSYTISICFPSSTKLNVNGCVCGVRYYSFCRKTNAFGMPDTIKQSKQTQDDIVRIINEEQPNLVHIFGTEFPHSLLAVRAFGDPRKTLISIQGLTSICALHYYANVPSKYIHLFSISSIVRGTMAVQKWDLVRRGKNEIEAIKAVNHIIGRTDWDKACIRNINTNACYYSCNETLRAPFYCSKKWKYDNCEKHSIFVSQSSQPLKGLHYLLNALPQVLSEYPDTHVYIAGNDPTKLKTAYDMISISSYGIYLRSLISKHRLSRSITFLGPLDANGMIHQYLKANVFALPSSIENSPNSLGEAMILGTPCVAANVGGISSLMVHKEEGLLYQHDASYMLGDCIKRVFDSGPLVEIMSAKAIEHASKTHERVENYDKTIKIYNETVRSSD